MSVDETETSSVRPETFPLELSVEWLVGNSVHSMGHFFEHHSQTTLLPKLNSVKNDLVPSRTVLTNLVRRVGRLIDRSRPKESAVCYRKLSKSLESTGRDEIRHLSESFDIFFEVRRTSLGLCVPDDSTDTVESRALGSPDSGCTRTSCSAHVCARKLSTPVRDACTNPLLSTARIPRSSNPY